jgi:hypothetical protein
LCPSTQALHVELAHLDARIKSGHDALMAGGSTLFPLPQELLIRGWPASTNVESLRTRAERSL